jgi:hypothetical protein
MFSIGHILYIIFSNVLVVGLLLLFRRAPFFQREKVKNVTLFIMGLSCFLVHVSDLWLGLPLGMSAEEFDIGTILILSPCAASMWALMIVGFMAVTGRNNWFARWLAAAVAYVGLVGAVVTVVGSNFYNDWFVVKNLISHTILQLGCLYLFTGGFVKIRINNAIPVLAFAVVCAAIGGLDIPIAILLGIENANPMYILEPIRGIYPLYGIVMFGICFVAGLVFAGIWEFRVCPKQERFYRKDYWRRFFCGE